MRSATSTDGRSTATSRSPALVMTLPVGTGAPNKWCGTPPEYGIDGARCPDACRVSALVAGRNDSGRAARPASATHPDAAGRDDRPPCYWSGGRADPAFRPSVSRGRRVSVVTRASSTQLPLGLLRLLLRQAATERQDGASSPVRRRIGPPQ